MEYQWDKVIEHHFFKCSDFLEENLDDKNSTSDYVDDVIVRGYDVDGNDEDVDGENDDETNDVEDGGWACEPLI